MLMQPIPCVMHLPKLCFVQLCNCRGGGQWAQPADGKSKNNSNSKENDNSNNNSETDEANPHQVWQRAVSTQRKWTNSHNQSGVFLSLSKSHKCQKSVALVMRVRYCVSTSRRRNAHNGNQLREQHTTIEEEISVCVVQHNHRVR